MRQHLDEPAALAIAFDAEINAILEGKPSPPPNLPMARFSVAAMRDRDVYRAFVEAYTCVSLPQEVMARPNVAEKMRVLEGQELPSPHGMMHDDLLAVLAT